MYVPLSYNKYCVVVVQLLFIWTIVLYMKRPFNCRKQIGYANISFENISNYRRAIWPQFPRHIKLISKLAIYFYIRQLLYIFDELISKTVSTTWTSLYEWAESFGLKCVVSNIELRGIYLLIIKVLFVKFLLEKFSKYRI